MIVRNNNGQIYSNTCLIENDYEFDELVYSKIDEKDQDRKLIAT